MENTLNEIEARVLGCLIEKDLATPEYYPLTLNALTNACNQKSNRAPVLNLDENEVVRALDGLRFKQLALLSAEGGRAAKYRHILVEKMRLDPGELALLCELLLRGPQTAGELRIRGERMYSFADPGAVDAALQELMERTPPLVALLPRQPGQKEQRYAQLFTPVPEMTGAEADSSAEARRMRSSAESGRIAQLEEEVAALREEVAGLRQLVEEFRSQFD